MLRERTFLSVSGLHWAIEIARCLRDVHIIFSGLCKHCFALISTLSKYYGIIGQVHRMYLQQRTDNCLSYTHAIVTSMSQKLLLANPQCKVWLGWKIEFRISDGHKSMTVETYTLSCSLPGHYCGKLTSKLKEDNSNNSQNLVCAFYTLGIILSTLLGLMHVVCTLTS